MNDKETTEYVDPAIELGLFSDIDIVFADFIVKREKRCEHLELLRFAVMLLSKAVNAKHSCLDLQSVSGVYLHELIDRETELSDDYQPVRTPEYADWLQSISNAECMICEKEAGDDTNYIVITDDGFLYLHRYWKYEQIVVRAVLERMSSQSFVAVSKEDIKPAFEGLTNTRWQEIAVFIALRSNISIITGGPGTGKTTTVATILALLNDGEKRISLVAPTGKAAQRLKESILKTKNSNPFFKDIPEEAETIHSFLGYNPSQRSFKYNSSYKHPADILIVDETSMVSLPMMAQLVLALKPGCKIILLGDKDQLASVETGNVLSEFTALDNINAFSARTAEYLQHLGYNDIDVCGKDSDLHDIVVKLTYSHRFSGSSAIGVLSERVNNAHAVPAYSSLNELFKQQFEKGNISYSPVDTDCFETVLKTNIHSYMKEYIICVEKYISAVKTADLNLQENLINEILQHINNFKVLCAFKKHEVFGAAAVNSYIENKYFPLGRELFYTGKMIMIARNNKLLNLANGDVGVFFEDASGGMNACFQREKGYTKVPVAALPDYESAFATTIHKSQGSEYDNVIVVLGDDKESRMLTKELVYTAITRAKKSVSILAGEGVLDVATLRVTERRSRIHKML